jgi:LPS-assembly lipoprotein
VGPVRTHGRTYLIVLALAGASLALGGCGFTPLYAAPGVTSKLAAINVIAPQGRTGYLLHQHLDDAFAKNHNEPAEYTMRLAIAEARYPRGVRTDNVATRYEYVLSADYTLAAVPSGEVVKKGRVRVEVTYDSADQPYASIAEEQDAQDRAAEQAAERIQLELAAWIATGKPASKALPKIAPPPANDSTPTGLPTGD